MQTQRTAKKQESESSFALIPNNIISADSAFPSLSQEVLAPHRWQVLPEVMLEEIYTHKKTHTLFTSRMRRFQLLQSIKHKFSKLLWIKLLYLRPILLAEFFIAGFAHTITHSTFLTWLEDKSKANWILEGRKRNQSHCNQCNKENGCITWYQKDHICFQRWPLQCFQDHVLLVLSPISSKYEMNPKSERW